MLDTVGVAVQNLARTLLWNLWFMLKEVALAIGELLFSIFAKVYHVCVPSGIART